MSMDEQLLQELYGSETTQAEEEIKLAQVELVEAVAAEAGVDLNELDDQELAKFAEYVLSDEDELSDNASLQEDAYPQEKLAEADMMGRQMARSYIDELQQQTVSQGDNGMYYEKIASAMQDVADAWEQEKIALSSEELQRMLRGGAAAGDVNRHSDLALQLAEMEARAGSIDPLAKRSKGMGGFDTIGTEIANPAAKGKHKGTEQGRKAVSDYYEKEYKATGKTRPGDVKGPSLLSRAGDHIGRHKGKYIAGALGTAALGGGLYAMKKRKERQQKKTAAYLDHGYEALALAELYEPEEFAKEAEYRAAEILAANGIHPATFEEIQPEEIKLASFPGVEDAYDANEAEALARYNEMLDTAAMHIIDSILY